MLVSSIARFDAINTMNSASFAAVNASNNMISGINNKHAFGLMCPFEFKKEKYVWLFI